MKYANDIYSHLSYGQKGDLTMPMTYQELENQLATALTQNRQLRQMNENLCKLAKNAVEDVKVKVLNNRILILEAQNLSYRESLEWLVNLGYGKGKAGGEIEGGEFEEALESGKQALTLTPSPMIEGLREVMKDLEWMLKCHSIDVDEPDEDYHDKTLEEISKSILSRLKSMFGL